MSEKINFICSSITIFLPCKDAGNQNGITILFLMKSKILTRNIIVQTKSLHNFNSSLIEVKLCTDTFVLEVIRLMCPNVGPFNA